MRTIEFGTTSEVSISNFNLSYCRAKDTAAIYAFPPSSFKPKLLIKYTTIYSNENNEKGNSIFVSKYTTNISICNIINNSQNQNAYYIFNFIISDVTISDSIIFNNLLPRGGVMFYDSERTDYEHTIINVIHCLIDQTNHTRLTLNTDKISTNSFSNFYNYDTKACLLIPIDENEVREEEKIRQMCTCDFDWRAYKRSGNRI